MPREQEMLPKDKYTIFDKKERRYRKSIHSMFWIPGGLIGTGMGYFRNWVLVSLSPDFVVIHLRRGDTGLVVVCLDQKLTFDLDRIAQVDACQPTCQPSWFLSARFWRQDSYFNTDRGGRHLPGGCEYMLGSPLYGMRTRRSCRRICVRRILQGLLEFSAIGEFAP